MLIATEISFLKYMEDMSTMRVYDKDKKLVKIICNQCGVANDIVNELVTTDMLRVEKTWGYFSEKDGQVHHLDICERCYDRWISGFNVPVTAEEAVELI